MVPPSRMIDCLETKDLKNFGRKYEIMASRIDKWKDKGFFKVTLCHHCYLLCVCYHLKNLKRC